jgi:CRP/FNR family transcriptional regulator
VIRAELGQQLWTAGAAARQLLYIESGVVKLELGGGSKKPICLGVFGPGDTIGVAAFMEGRFHRAEARVITAASILQVLMPSKGDNLLRVQWLQSQLLKNLRVYLDQIEMLSADRIEGRLLDLFLHWRSRFCGDASDREVIKIPFVLSKTQIASIINTRIETAIRILNRWEKAGIILFAPHDIQVSSIEALLNFVKIVQ